MSTDVWRSETETFVSDDGGVEKTESGPQTCYYGCRCVKSKGNSQDSDSAFMCC